jgi:glucose-1-phosphate cytidylyltransferase
MSYHDERRRGGTVKVVIFCGGLGVRMGEETRSIPKPMIQIGGRPILWHIMKYYARWGHNEFILCLGYKGEVIKQYFLSYNEALFNDFVLEQRGAGAGLELLSEDLGKWKITFVDTGINANIAERLKAVEAHIGDDDALLATYGDGLTDVSLSEVIDAFHAGGKTAMFISVRPEFNAHLVSVDEDGTVLAVSEMSRSHVRINGGFFVLRREIFDWIEPGDELVEETFERLIQQRELAAFRHDGFFGPMDTIKDRQRLEALHESGRAPWQLVGPDVTADRGPG